MPSSSIDTFLACSIMIILALSGIVGTSKLMAPYLKDLAHSDDSERFQRLASHLFLNAGIPENWGQLKDTTLTSLGLAEADTTEPYELDMDKVTRLNNQNMYSLEYAELWQALGVKDVSFRIEIQMLFEISIELISNATQGNQTLYEFRVTAQRSGMPVSASLSSYATLGNFVGKNAASTSSDGVGTLTVTIPNSISGTALLLVFALSTADQRIVSFGVCAFGHNSQSPLPNGTFMRLNPLNHVLNASLLYDSIEVSNARVFTFGYNFSLTVMTQNIWTLEYMVPRLLEASPMVFVLTGLNGSASFAEWVAYPQVPLQIGADFSDSTAGSRITAQSHIVTINSAFYEVVTKWGGLSNDV